MKAKFLLLALASTISVAVFSQGFKLGLKGGATINKITGKSFKEEFSFGYHVGGFAEIGLGKKFAIQPEVLFNQINIDTSDNFSTIYDFNQVSNVQLKYISIPLLLNYKAGKFITLQAGPQFGILIDQNKNLLQNGKDAFKSGDFSMLGGIQLNIMRFNIYGRYAIGLNNINDIDNNDKWKNQNIQVGVGFAIL